MLTDSQALLYRSTTDQTVKDLFLSYSCIDDLLQQVCLRNSGQWSYDDFKEAKFLSHRLKRASIEIEKVFEQAWLLTFSASPPSLKISSAI